MTAPDIPAEIAERAETLCDQFRHIEDDRELIARVLMEVGQGSPIPSRLGLTPLQAGGLEFITGYVKSRGASPSFDEIADGLGMKSRRAVHRLVHQLVDRGVISMAPYRARSITIVGRA